MFDNCISCNAQLTGPVCEYCGRRVSESEQIQREKKKLSSFLNKLRSETDDEKRVTVIKHGFIPSSEQGLLAAGLDIIPFMSPAEDDINVQAAAVTRLQAIMTRLRLLPTAEPIEKSLAEFELAIAAYKREDRHNMLLGIGCFGICLAAMAGGIYWLTQLF
ncbi:MAG: hypothetical protein AAGD96_31460 [Chloroflexota bacterium]